MAVWIDLNLFDFVPQKFCVIVVCTVSILSASANDVLKALEK